ncbi:Sec-independent protein translocase subunit TatA [Streptomyces sp. NPDC002265]|uniref:Sec-independent protein translocase subunit TatA n=1 Tax=Streptomyces sp. NPDC002265 TaxID=3154415 RepID=UPI0033209BD3
MFGRLGAPEILLVLVVLLLLFGAKRLPDMARSFGQSLRILKSETKAMRGDDEDQPHTGGHMAAPAPQPVSDGPHAAPKTAEEPETPHRR